MTHPLVGSRLPAIVRNFTLSEFIVNPPGEVIPDFAVPVKDFLCSTRCEMGVGKSMVDGSSRAGNKGADYMCLIAERYCKIKRFSFQC